MKKKLASRTGVFGSTAKRFQDKAPKETSPTTLVPQHDEPRFEPSPPKPSPMFASKANRFTTAKASAMPSPGSYDVRQEWVQKHGKGILHSGAKRFVGKTPKAADGAGPGAYEVAQSFKKPYANTKSTLSTEKRFATSSAKHNLTPGPGAYDANVVTGDMNTPTYNITIAEEMERGCRRRVRR